MAIEFMGALSAGIQLILDDGRPIGSCVRRVHNFRRSWHFEPTPGAVIAPDDLERIALQLNANNMQDGLVRMTIKFV